MTTLARIALIAWPDMQQRHVARATCELATQLSAAGVPASALTLRSAQREPGAIIHIFCLTTTQGITAELEILREANRKIILTLLPDFSANVEPHAALELSEEVAQLSAFAVRIFTPTRPLARKIRKLVHCPVELMPWGCESNEGISAEPFYSQYSLRNFVLSTAPLAPRFGQLEFLRALQNFKFPVVLTGYRGDNDEGYIQELKKVQRGAPTLIIDELAIPMQDSAIIGCAAFFVPGSGDGIDAISLRVAFLGRPIIAHQASAAARYFDQHAHVISTFHTLELRNAVTAAIYAPFDSFCRDAALSCSWSRVAEQLRTVYSSCELHIDQTTQPSLTTYRCAPSVVDFSTIAAVDSALAPGLCAQGEQALVAQRHDEAFHFFMNALRGDGANARAHRGCAEVCIVQHRFEEAHTSLLRASINNPVDFKTVVLLLQVAPKVGQFADLEWALAQYNGAKPGNVELLYAHAVTLFQLDRRDDAIKKLDLIIATWPGRTDAVTFLHELKQDHAGETNFSPTPPTTETGTQKTATEMLALKGTVLTKVAALRKEGDVVKAVQLLNEIFNCSPSDNEALQELALCLLESHHYAAALAVFDTALQQRPSNPELLAARNQAIQRAAAPVGTII